MSAGMITGSSSAAVLTTGAIAFPILKSLGLNKRRSGALIAMAAIFGMIAPPVNIPAMIIGQGVDMPYIGFTVPLLLLTFPLAIFTSFFLGIGKVHAVKKENLKKLPPFSKTILLYVPLILLIVLMILENTPFSFSLGLPLIFFISAITACFSGKKENIFKVSYSALKKSVNILSILIGVGMFIQIMTMNGTRGLIVSFLNDFPPQILVFAIALGIPLFGAVSSYGAASVLGVPFLLAFLGNNDIVVCASLSLLAGLGDMVPPTALAGIFAAHVVGEKNYFKIWLQSLPIFFVTMGFATFVLYNSKEFGKLISSNIFLPVFFGIIAVMAVFALLLDSFSVRRNRI
jgi:TRAP-type C4-dicarboxylate transport system permease large subunit